MTNKFFETKQQYVNFRKAFATASNDPRAKKQITESEAHIRDGSGGYKKAIVKTKHAGWLSASHYIFLNIVRDKPYFYGFSPKTKANHVKNGDACNRALINALSDLSHVVSKAKGLGKNKVEDVQLGVWQRARKSEEEIQKIKEEKFNKEFGYMKHAVDTFLAPFGGTITVEDLTRIQVPQMDWIIPNQKGELLEKFAGQKLTYPELLSLWYTGEKDKQQLLEVKCYEPRK